MRRTRTKRYWSAGSSYAGRPRVVNDYELYGVVAQMAEGDCSKQELLEYVRMWSSPYEDWQLAIICQRARLFVGCLRQERARRLSLDPNQLMLLERNEGYAEES